MTAVGDLRKMAFMQGSPTFDDWALGRRHGRIPGRRVHVNVNPGGTSHALSVIALIDDSGNVAERMIRPAVILRKVSQSNRSEKGPAVQAVLMGVYRTLNLRGHAPLATITSTLRTYMSTGELPPLPIKSVADG